jgi:hypothetical protein
LLGSLLEWQEKSLFSNAGWEGVEITDMTVRSGSDLTLVGKALAAFENLCAPSRDDLAARKLLELRALTVHRAWNDDDVELMAGAYASRLAWYPPDVIVAACDAWADREEFWPAWAELKAECDKKMRRRLQIRSALRAALP